MLTQAHIAFIIRELNHRGFILEGFQDEVIDHVCSAVEKEMESGKKFKEAYDEVMRAFGNSSGLAKTQDQVIRVKHNNTISMLKNYFIVGLRNHFRQKFYTLINIAGLAVGVASCLIIALYVNNELSYDRHFENSDRIYRVDMEIKFGPNHIIVGQCGASLTHLLQQDYPEIEAYTRVTNWGPTYFKSTDGKETLRENDVVWADSSFFKIFSIPVIEGNRTTALREPNTVALSRSTAKRYFPEGNALGKSIVLPDNTNLMVTAVYEDLPQNSHFHFSMVLSMVGREEAKNLSLLGGGDLTQYILLPEGVSIASFNEKLDAFVDKHVAPQLVQVMGTDFTMEKFRASGEKWEYSLMPLTDIHLNSDKLGELEANGNIVYVYLLAAIGFFVLCIGCINFMNLSTARSMMRAKEVGVRKVMGSLRTHLVKQFLIESITLCFLAIVLSVGVAVLFLPYFNELAQKNITIPFQSPAFYWILLGCILAIGILAGLYPSMFLSAFKPVTVLKGGNSPGVSGTGIRSALVVFQFVISILLIIGTIAVNRQIKYIQERSLGFQKDQVIIVKEAQALGAHAVDFKKEALQNSFIKSGSISGFLPVEGYWRNNNTLWPEGMEISAKNFKDMVSIQTWDVDNDYIQTLGMKLVEGRDFSEQMASDSTAVILNQSAVRRFGFSDAVGKRIHEFGGQNPEGTPDLNNIKTYTVIGVVEDFHFGSMKKAISPLGLFLAPSGGSVSFKFDPLHTAEVITTLEAEWKEKVSDRPFQYSFLDEDFEKTYYSEEKLSKIFASFATLAIVIACLGLFALTSFTAEQRAKEIGIRKVLGASVNSIVILLSKEFGKLVLISFILAVPLAWFGIDWWIKSYEYRTTIGVWVYVVAGIAAFVIAMLTMGFQSIKAAMSNPAKVLRSE